MEAEKNRALMIAFVGAGLIGKERLLAVKKLAASGRPLQIAGIYDPYCKDSDKLGKELGVSFVNSLEALYDAAPDWFFLATPHDTATQLSKEILRRGFNLLVEKPLGRSLTEAKTITAAAIRSGQLWVGFNYRFFEGITAALEDVREDRFGRIISVSINLGHGCHPGIKDGWKLDAERAGGGCLIDPGIHVLDLCRMMARGDIGVRAVWNWDGFWKTGIEEESHLVLSGPGFLFNIQVSIVKWRSTFDIRINGEDGYGIITGRNRSYGKQTYVRGRRWGWMTAASQKDSEETVVETTGEDVFVKEIDALLFPQNSSFVKPCSAEEALSNMELLDKCRESARRI